MSRLERNEVFLKGAAAGALGGVVRYLFRELLQFAGVTQFDTNMTSLNVVMGEFQAGPFMSVFGFITTLIIGAFWGVLIAFTFRHILTSNRYLFKGAVLGIGIWLFEFGFAAEAFGYHPELLLLPAEIASVLLGLTLYGLATSYMLRRMGLFSEG